MAIGRQAPSIQLAKVTGEVAGLVSDLSHLPEELLKVPERIAREDIERADRALAELMELSKSLWIKTGIPPRVFQEVEV